MSGAFIYGTPSFDSEFSDQENDEMVFTKIRDSQILSVDANANNEHIENAEEVDEEDDSHVQLIDLKEEKIDDPEKAPVVIEQAEDDILMNTATAIEEDEVEKIELFYDGPASRQKQKDFNAPNFDILKPIRCSVIKIGPLAKPETSDDDEIEEMHLDNNIRAK